MEIDLVLPKKIQTPNWIYFSKIIIYNFPTPEADYAILPLISIGILTNLPLYTALIVKKFVKKRQIKKKMLNTNPNVDQCEMIKLHEAINKTDCQLDNAEIADKH